MAIDVRPCTWLEEMRESLVITHYFGASPTDEDAERVAQLVPLDRMLAASDEDEIVGGAGSFPFDLSLPGGRRTASAGVTVVGVLPTARRRGVLSSLMRAQLDDIRARGEAVAWLWSSEPTIYGRYGYGLASFSGECTIPRDRSAFVDDRPAQGRVRSVSAAQAAELFPKVYDRVFAQRAGLFSRSSDWWEKRRLVDYPARRGGAGELHRVVLEIDGEPVGYALYRLKIEFGEASVAGGSVVVLEALGVTPQATREIWRFLLDHDLASRLETRLLPVDHPLLLLLAEARRMRFIVSDALWVRLVDVGAALSARGYASPEPLVFEVEDGFCPWNTGRWRLADGVASRTQAPPDLRMDVSALGAAYLGGVSFARLLEADRVVPVTEGAVERADRVFATNSAPWCPEIF